ncbi:polysaccharide deacetylase family protein [Halpernia frigidisoli]|uniref:Polysaccharide deacetylase n=1 Tax=Halpernia frigidisoli TaxID=1125876 RepID=A0A1I3FNB9_9FLAO|nr:polysaccharide deacetylase family protein [Halpernia frigidisoli]SFI12768.1 Polysaccharide deacetylase [Halpernia frigidisoli]
MLKQNLKKLNKFIPFQAKFPLPFVIPLYHCISDEHLPHLKQVINYKNTKEFEKDLDEMSKKFDFVEWDFFKENYNKSHKKPIAMLTFDDGLIEFKDVVLPVLKRKGIYAINFVNPAFVDNSEMMFRFKASLILEKFKNNNYKVSPSIQKFLNLTKNTREEITGKVQSISYLEKEKLDILSVYSELNFKDYQSKNKIYMSLEDLQLVKNDGFGIAAHSWDHPYYFELSLEQQLENTQKSLDFMTENNFVNDAFAFPFTDHKVSKYFFQKLFDHNENLKLTFGISGIKIDEFPKNLHRIPMENGFSAKEEISFEKNYYQIKNLLNKNILQRS